MFERIIASGQAGVDRAALDVALELGIACTGWCPNGRAVEDGSLPPHYPIRETPTSGSLLPIEWNVRDADGVLVLTRGEPSGAAAVSIEFCTRAARPHLVVDLSSSASPSVVVAWQQQYHVRQVNVTGPRESRVPGIHAQAADFLRAVLTGTEPLTAANVPEPEHAPDGPSELDYTPSVGDAPVAVIDVDAPISRALIIPPIDAPQPLPPPEPSHSVTGSAAPSTDAGERLRWSRFQTAVAIEGAVLYGLYRMPLSRAEQAGWMACGFALVAIVSIVAIDPQPADGPAPLWRRVASSTTNLFRSLARHPIRPIRANVALLALGLILINVFNGFVASSRAHHVATVSVTAARPSRPRADDLVRDETAPRSVMRHVPADSVSRTRLMSVSAASPPQSSTGTTLLPRACGALPAYLRAD